MGLSSFRIIAVPIKKVTHAIEFLSGGGILPIAECGILSEENIKVIHRGMTYASLLLFLLLPVSVLVFTIRERLLSHVN